MNLPKNVHLALCDFETTGVNPDKDDPIEVAVLLLDPTLHIVGAYESLIQQEVDLASDALLAYRVHGIDYRALKDAPSRASVAMGVRNLVARAPKGARVVLCSDNIQFEWKLMERLLGCAGSGWPFHYCGWDTSLLLETTGIGDPKSAHRAMADVGLLYRAVLASVARIQGVG